MAALLGSALGVILTTLMLYIPIFGGLMHAKWSVQTFALAIGLALLLGLLGGIYPAWRAGRLQPVEALRYE